MQHLEYSNAFLYAVSYTMHTMCVAFAGMLLPLLLLLLLLQSNDRAHFSNYITEDFTSYIARKQLDGVHGNNPEIQAISELFNRPIEVLITA
jgi:OTU-like cysteine protease